jgi:hypothetical protein
MRRRGGFVLGMEVRLLGFVVAILLMVGIPMDRRFPRAIVLM